MIRITVYWTTISPLFEWLYYLNDRYSYPDCIQIEHLEQVFYVLTLTLFLKLFIFFKVVKCYDSLKPFFLFGPL